MCLYLVFAQRRTAHSSSEALEDDEAHLCFCARPHSVSVFHPVFIGLRLQGGKARVNIAGPPHSWCLTFALSGRRRRSALERAVRARRFAILRHEIVGVNGGRAQPLLSQILSRPTTNTATKSSHTDD